MAETPDEAKARIRGDLKAGSLFPVLLPFPCEHCAAEGKRAMVVEGSNCAICKRFPTYAYREEQTAAARKAEAARKAAAGKR